MDVSKKMLINIDMNGNEIKNVTVDKVDTLPETAIEGQIKYLTTTVGDNEPGLYLFTSEGWKELAQGGDVSGLVERVDGLEDRIETAEGDIETLEGDMTDAKADIVALKGKVGDEKAGLVKDVADLKTTVGDSSSGLVKDVADLDDKKFNKDGYTSEAGNFLKVGADGAVTFGTPDAQVQASWTETDDKKVSFIVGKPFKTVGTGLTVTTEGALTADTQFKFQIFETLPTASATYAQTIALIANSGAGQNIYDEFGCVNEGGTWKWERLGTTDFTLNIVQNASGITINDTALQSASASQKGLLASADFTTFAGKQDALDATQMKAVNSGIDSDKVTAYDAYAGQIALKANSADVYTKSEVYAKTETYTQGEVDNLLGDKADVATTYTKTEVDDLLDDKVEKNADITGATKCKITYDAKGLVTAGADLVANDIPDLDASKITTGQFAKKRMPNGVTYKYTGEITGNGTLTSWNFPTDGTITSPGGITITDATTGEVVEMGIVIGADKITLSVNTPPTSGKKYKVVAFA